jgi:hypothetical protein
MSRLYDAQAGGAEKAEDVLGADGAENERSCHPSK